jgi:hypothetical protein
MRRAWLALVVGLGLLVASRVDAAGPNYCTGAIRATMVQSFENGAIGTDSCGAVPQTFTNTGVTGDTTNYTWGLQSGDFERTESDYLRCTSATCAALDVGGVNQQFSICADGRLEEVAASIPHHIFTKDDNTSSVSRRGVSFAAPTS